MLLPSVLSLIAAAMAAVDAFVLAPMIPVKDKSLIIPDQYIVVLKEGHESGNIGSMASDDHIGWLTSMIAEMPDAGARLQHRFNAEGLRGYSGKFSDHLIDEIRKRPEVRYVEPDQVVYALDMVEGMSRKAIFHKLFSRRRSSHPRGSPLSKSHSRRMRAMRRNQKVMKQSDATWGLSRVSHGKKPLDMSYYHYPRSAGKGVDVYVVDTGINIAHVDFEGRARWGKTIPFEDADIDGNGHGTHCAGTIAGRRYGIAKKANVVAVKVLRTNGFGTNADVIKGIEWVIRSAKRNARRGRKSAANMSLGGGKSFTLEETVNRAVRAGVHFAVAAGNDNEDACDYSPAGASGPVTVGASTSHDEMAFFSNHGSCVDIFAPGLDITSAWIGSRFASNTISGTSMASPHVAGVLALYLGEKDYEPKELKELLIEQANKGILKELPERTENLLLSTKSLLVDLTDDGDQDGKE